jgi:hypothetical protein
LASKAKVAQAVRRFKRFTGMEPEGVDLVKVTLPDAALLVGDVLGIMYETERDGVVESYIHKFREGSRPQLAASQDGKQLVLLGGAYQFTERGIVDK